MNANERSEELRVRYKYRELIMKGVLRLPVAAATRLIGPDCAYHLYAGIGDPKMKSETDKGA
jgi:hypothetical protein